MAAFFVGVIAVIGGCAAERGAAVAGAPAVVTHQTDALHLFTSQGGTLAPPQAEVPCEVDGPLPERVIGQWVPDMEAIARVVAASKGGDDGFWLLMRTDLLIVRADGTFTHCGLGEGVCRARGGRVELEGNGELRGYGLLLPPGGAPCLASTPEDREGLALVLRRMGTRIDPAALEGTWRLNEEATVESLADDTQRIMRLTEAAEMGGEGGAVRDEVAGWWRDRAKVVAYAREMVEDARGSVLEFGHAVDGRGSGTNGEGGDKPTPMVYRVEGDLVLVRQGTEEDHDGGVWGLTRRGDKLVLEFGFLPWVYSR